MRRYCWEDTVAGAHVVPRLDGNQIGLEHDASMQEQLELPFRKIKKLGSEIRLMKIKSNPRVRPLDSRHSGCRFCCVGV